MRYRALTVGQLREAIRDADENAPILIPDADHSYRQDIIVCKCTALFGDGDWFEDCDEDQDPAEYDAKRFDAIVIQ